MNEEVLRILLKHYTKISRNGGIAKVIFDDEFEIIADEIVKLFAVVVESVCIRGFEAKSHYCIECENEDSCTVKG